MIKDLVKGNEDLREQVESLMKSNEHLKDQVESRRSLWVTKHSPNSVARAFETLADSAQDNDAAHKAIMSMKALAIRGGPDDCSSSRQPEQDMTRHYGGGVGGGGGDMAPPARPPSVFQRSSTAAPPKFGPLQAGPPRAPSTFSHDRRYNQGSSWSSTQARVTHGQGQSQSPFQPTGPSSSSSSFSRPPPPPPPPPPTARKTYHSSRYRPTAAEFQPGAAYVFSENVPSRPGTAFGHQQPSSSTRGDHFPQTPTSGYHNRYGRFHDAAVNSNINSATATTNNNNNHGSDYGSTPSAPGAAAATTTTMVHRNSLSGPLIHMTDRSVGAWNECIMDFYALIRAFVERHASIPDAAMAMRISTTPLWPVLLATYHPLSAREATSYLDLHLREDNPKCCLVTRVIIDYIVNRVWVPGAWTGSGSGQDQVSYELLDLEKDLQKTQGQPSAHRQPLLDKQSRLVDLILKTEPPQFHSSKVREITHSLGSAIRPLLNRLHNPTDAARDLEQVADHAWELSSKILTSRLTFDFRFPEVGTRFSSQSMLPIWPAMDPSELQAKHWRVALVTTPVITCRNDTGSNISAHSVALADVYCMQ
ncbi:hypothetical protein QQS21_012380 [Conoideocrella luteorostrata]|uniref:Uncharacterized protein n=1 Tax=Conoideocrella luteorostrata TaxID=1105319 RepID=A0AAJ0FMF6_9HYPO|nr:hypothetical protein QQS21_012380 [Conoideocrella luteorostrata]